MVKLSRLLSFWSQSLRYYKLYLLYLIVFLLGYYSSYIKLSDNSVENISEISEYISGFEKVKNKQKYRMGYPLVGPIRGYFTEDGYVLDDRYPKLVDISFMGIKSDSIADSSLINIANPLPIQNNNISRNLDFTDQAEISIIKQFAKFYNYPESKLRGYVTSGGTEGNLACLWYGREYLAKFNHRPNDKIVLYSSNQAHYSIIKIANILQLELRLINTDAKGNIDLNHFSNLIKLHKISEYNKPLIVVATIGTTELGGIDDIVSIKKILDHSKLKYVMHADAALLGAVLPIIEPYGPIDSIFDYVDSIAISGHKFFGTRSIVGIALTKLSILKEAFAKHDIHIKYINDKEDTTISGTRNASNILEFDYTLKILGLEKNSIKLNKLVKQSIKNAEYFYKELLKIYKNEQVIYNKNQFIVVFPKPTNTVLSKNIKNKFDLRDVGTNSFGVYILPNVNIGLIDQLLKSLQQTKD